MQNHLKIFIFAAILFSFSFGAIAAKKGPVLARVGKVEITLKDFNKRYEDITKMTPNPPSKKVFLEDLVRFEVGVQEAKKQRIERNPIVRERIRQELYKGLVEKKIGKKVNKLEVSEREMRRYYRKSPEVLTSHILIQIKPGATKKEKSVAKKRAFEIYKEVKKSKRPFGELVSLYTDDILTKKTGGDIGWQTRITLNPMDERYYETALKMKVGQISRPFETRHGFHIVKLRGKNPYKKANKRPIQAAIYGQKKKKVFDQYFSNLKSKYSIKVYPSRLK